MRFGLTLVRYVCGVLLLGIVIVAGIAIRIVHFAQPNDAVTADAIVVLGAAQYNGRPSEVFAARLDHAAGLYRAGKAQHIITVGGRQEGDALTEGEAGRRYLVAAGIPSDAVVASGVGHDTLVSLRAAHRVAAEHGWTSVIIVTDPWHEERCRMIARDLGLWVETSPVESGPAAADAVESRYVWREILGTLFYRLVGGSSGAGTPVL